jgi:hypothetical protein
MRYRNVFIAAVAPLLVFVAPTAAGDMRYPDWQSQWRNPTSGRGGNPWDPDKPMGLGQQAPLTPEYQAIFEQSVQAHKSGSQGNSRGSTCILPGMPKVMNFSEPMEIIIRPDITYFVPQRYPVRRIYTDGRDWPIDEQPTFGGTSIGRWIDEDHDGRYDVLEIETRNFKGPRVFESTGLPLHADNRTVVKERIYLDNKDILHNEVTTIDNALARPWTVDRIHLREPVRYWVEENCHETNGHSVIGAEEYFVSADGKLMPVRVGQPPPDLSQFRGAAVREPGEPDAR